MGQPEEAAAVAAFLASEQSSYVVGANLYVDGGTNHRGGSRRWLLTALDDSLRRLGVDHVDLFQIHRWDATTSRSTFMPQRFDTTIASNRAKFDAVEQLAKVADQAGLTLIQLALGFVTAHPAVTSAIIGPRTPEHLRSQLAAADTVLSGDLLDAIDAIVAPGVDLAAHEKNDTPPALLDPSLRRRS